MKCKSSLRLVACATYGTLSITDVIICSTLSSQIISNAYKKEDTPTLRKALKAKAISPDVVFADGKFYVSCCYFTNFGGMIQETVEIAIDNGKASFHVIEQKTLVEYDCGIRF